MNSQATAYLFTLLVIAVTVLGTVGFMRKPEKTRSVYTLNNSPVDPKIKVKADMWDNYLKLILPNSDRKLSQHTILKDTSGRQFTLKDLTHGRYRVVLKYNSYTDCDVCVDLIMDIVKQQKRKRLDYDFIAVTTSYSERDFVIKAASKNYDSPVYNLPEGSLGLDLEDKGLPFFFVITPDYRVTKLFIPLKEFPKQIEEYLLNMQSFVHTANSQL